MSTLSYIRITLDCLVHSFEAHPSKNRNEIVATFDIANLFAILLTDTDIEVIFFIPISGGLTVLLYLRHYDI